MLRKLRKIPLKVMMFAELKKVKKEKLNLFLLIIYVHDLRRDDSAAENVYFEDLSN